MELIITGAVLELASVSAAAPSGRLGNQKGEEETEVVAESSVLGGRKWYPRDALRISVVLISPQGFPRA